MSSSSAKPYITGVPVVADGKMVNAAINMLSQPHESLPFDTSQQRAMKALSGFQIFIGLSSIIIQVMFLAVKRYTRFYLDVVGTGIWCGAIYLVAGALGVAAARKNQADLAIGTMVMSILSTVSIWCSIGFSAANIGMSTTGGDCCYYDGAGRPFCSCYIPTNEYLAADCIMIILAIGEFIVSLWAAILCCKGACRVCCPCCDNFSYATQPVMYSAGQPCGPQVIFVPPSDTLGSGTQHLVMLTAPQSDIPGSGSQHLVMLTNPPSIGQVLVPQPFGCLGHPSHVMSDR